MIRTSLIAHGKRRDVMSVLLALLVLLVYAHLARFYQGRIDGWILALGWTGVTINLLRAVLGLAYRRDRHPFRRFDLGLHDDRAEPGGVFRLELVAEPRRRGTLDSLTATLRCVQETVREGRRETRLLEEQKHEMAAELALEPQRLQRFDLSLAIPRSAPYSYRDFQGRIRWSIELVAAVRNWGLLADVFEVTVGPSGLVDENERAVSAGNSARAREVE